MLLLLAVCVSAQNDPLLSLLKHEMNREFQELQTKEYPPYFMEFRAMESYSWQITSSMGYIQNKDFDYSKSFAPAFRVGSYKFDNTHEFDDYGSPNSYGRSTCMLPLENDADLLTYKVWERSNSAYQRAVDVYKEFLEKVKDEDTAKVADFSIEEPTVFFDAPLSPSELEFDMDGWCKRMNSYTEVFCGMPEVFSATASFAYGIDRNYLLNTENTELVQNERICTIYFLITIKSPEGEMIPFSHSYYAFTPNGLPSDSALKHDMLEIKEKLLSLAKAPKAEPFTGPAILSSGAAGVFFHEIFGHRIEGHRMGQARNSKTFKNKVGEEILNKSLSVYSDPTQNSYSNKDLIGYYRYDNQGVKAQRVNLIDNGVLKDFLMSRKPIEGFDKSNGHGRSNLGASPVSRQSNLFVESVKPNDWDKLRKKLKKECKRQKCEYGYYFKTVAGGLTNTMSYSPDYFNIFPIEVFRVYVDGRPDELVRGVNLIGTPLIMFSEILAAGSEYEVFSGMCGAESGYLPVSTVAPAILVRKIETQNQFAYKPEWPLLPDPEIVNDQSK